MTRLAVLALGLAAAVAAAAADDPPAPPTRAEVQKGVNNLKQIGLGLHNYHDTMGRFPGDMAPDGKTAWSWRVQLLPQIEQSKLYEKLDFKLAWDAPANKAVLEKAEMPKLFEVPGRPADKGKTYCRSFSSAKKAKAGRAWLTAGERGPNIAGVRDGLSNTFAVVEAGEAVPWYAPDELTYDPDKPLPQLGGKDAPTFLALMGDGSVRPVPRKTDEKVLRALITRDGGEVVTLPDDDRPRPAAPAKSAPPTAKSSAPPPPPK